MLSVLEIGEKITVARKIKNFSQAQLAEILAVSAQAVGKWERGESMPDIIMFGRLAETFGVDLNYFGGEGCVPQSVKAEEETNRKSGWNMSGGIWADADFSGLRGLAEKFSGANIDKCIFNNSELFDLTLKGNIIKHSDFTSSNLKGSKFIGVNLENNIFYDCDFTKSEFSGSNIKNCDFSDANLTDAVIKRCSLKKIKLSGAVLIGTSFKMGQLTEIIFDGEIKDCSFENCDFARVEFKGAIIRNTFFKDCKLARAIFTACKADKLSYAFMKTCKADLSDTEVIE